MGESNKLKSVRKSSGNIYNYENALPIVANFVIINNMYYGMEKADKFYEKKETGKKKKSVSLFGDILPIARKRFENMKSGANFRLSNHEVDEIINVFGIDIKYFRTDHPIMLDISYEGNDINEDTWNHYFHNKYNGPTEYKDRKEINKNDPDLKAIHTAFENLKGRDWINDPDKDNPLFKIGYYFSTGKRYEPISRVDKCINALKDVRFRDWHSEDDAKLEECRQLLKDHYDYINSLMVINRLINKEK